MKPNQTILGLALAALAILLRYEASVLAFPIGVIGASIFLWSLKPSKP